MDEKKNVAVVLPVYNGASMLEACIRSVSAAGERVSEIIIVDDGSTDETLARARAIANRDHRIHIISTDNHGSYMARVTGIRAATADFLAFIDVDDHFIPGSLDLLAGLLESCDADISFGGIIETENCSSVNIPDAEAAVRIQTSAEMWPRIMKWKTQEFMLYIWHKLYKRELFDDLPEIDHICQGDDVILTCAAFRNAKRIAETTAPVYLYCINPSGLTHRGFSDSDLDLIRVWDTVVDMMDSQDNPDLSYLARFNRWRTDYTLITRLILTDDKKADRKYAEELVKWRNGLKRHWRDLISPHAMPADREILVFGLRFFYVPVKVLLRMGKRASGISTGVLLHSGDKRHERRKEYDQNIGSFW